MRRLVILVAALTLTAGVAIQRQRLTAGAVLAQTTRVPAGTYDLKSADLAHPAITIRGSNITVDFSGVTLRGAAPEADPDTFTGLAVLVDGGATALVNEAYLRLVDVRRVQWQDRAHFFAMAARLMRRVLVDFARAQKNQKRGGALHRVTFDQNLPVASETPEDVIAIDEALRSLAAQYDTHPTKPAGLRCTSGRFQRATRKPRSRRMAADRRDGAGTARRSSSCRWTRR